MKIYTIDKLIDGYKINKELSGRTIVCCKNTKGYTHISHNGKIMALPETPLLTLQFEDKFGKGNYWLSYYEWTPIENEDLWGLKLAQPDEYKSSGTNGINRRDNAPITCLPSLHNSPEAGA